MTPLEEIVRLSDIPVDVEVQLDQKVTTIAAILDWVPGTVIRMGRSAGENIDILVNNAALFYGEIVIIEDAVGVRITDFREEE